jgi:hypothetical protein
MMLARVLSEYIGGKVIAYKSKYRWQLVGYNKKGIENILEIFEQYPPLTKKLTHKLDFVRKCLDQDKEKNSISFDWYSENRNNIYSSNADSNEPLDKVQDKTYFKIWLSGFLTVRSELIVKKTSDHNEFIIKHTEQHLLFGIGQYFSITNIKKSALRAQNDKNNFMLITRKKRIINLVTGHLSKFPTFGKLFVTSQKFNRYYIKTSSLRGRSAPAPRACKNE